MALSRNLAARVVVTAVAAGIASPQNIGSLKGVAVPQSPELNRYVKDPEALLVLGKAFFWDMQAGSDGRTACATCHFHAGADHRLRNQLAKPGSALPVDHQFTLSDFPLRALSDPNNNRSDVLRDTSSVVGSAGLFRRIFVDIATGSFSDDGFDAGDVPEFAINGVNVRRVTARNSPTVINSVFYQRNFWDGRASNIFTGATPFGEADKRSNALAIVDGKLAAEAVRVSNASLASQAVGPILDGLEMSYDGRTWPKLGKKMLALRPLALQKIAGDDSVLGSYADASGRGLAVASYLALVQAAYKAEYWNSAQLVDTAGRDLGRAVPARSTGEFTQAEFNFPLFWGLAIQAYEATLISNDSRFDRFSDGQAEALTAQEQRGLTVFRNGGGCTGTCHVGPEFSSATFTGIARRGTVQNGRGGANGDTGFFRTGVRPIAEDIGLAADNALGAPLSLSVAQRPASLNTVQGAFKTPTLRNVEFTGPFFHNGGQATLEQVVEFYARGGDFPGNNGGNGIRRRNINSDDRNALVAFLKALSDDRVRFERAPFDHPELCVPVGQDPKRVDASDRRFSMSATDSWAAIPAVGRNGNKAPLQTFDELLAGFGADGSRAHTLTEACTVP